MWATAKAILGGKFIATSTDIKQTNKQKRHRDISNKQPNDASQAFRKPIAN
jgi:hypothetical protein